MLSNYYLIRNQMIISHKIPYGVDMSEHFILSVITEKTKAELRTESKIPVAKSRTCLYTLMWLTA